MKITTFTNNTPTTYNSATTIPVFNPHTGKEIAQLEFTPPTALDTIVADALIAQKQWQRLTYKKRAEIFYRYRELLELNRLELARLIHEDNGKSMLEAMAEIDKCIELTEFSCSIPQIISGESQQVSRGIECQEHRRPLGVVAVITPFNFPLMVPHWSVPNALMLGNAVILKPSESTPLASFRMGALLAEAGLPKNLFHIVNGGIDIVKALATHPQIQALSFVGSTTVAKSVYQEAVAHNKRALCLGGAKNYVFAMKDTDPKVTASEILASAVGMAGQRCMALSVAVLVGDNPELYQELVTQAKNFHLDDPIPPLVSPVAITKIKTYTQAAIAKGATVLVDGQDFAKPANQADGYWHGPTLIDWTNCPDEMGLDEVFGPVLEIVQVPTIEAAIAFQNRSPYGNSVCIFTQSARIAQEVLSQCKAGMMGINIGVAVPREPFSFGGLNQSKFGYGDITGKSSINFWTDLIKVTTKWNPVYKVDWLS
ncbi:malonate-semialdehyde dehydrogenase (acetylating)/methylmalonate-semialdehyde dehydrogenase [Mycoplasmoides fastidiosum]|uniref:Malonate-semialdehyde dehydrogenase (Acetylating)/methylmalonate-semialdehyde dehydrogenase n=1 Tax=Mycoplasmoides fastidiosum TaxID=92758 RepID=A0ABU0LZJ6_9BACT|nr:aldehyde dehydrogenase family protein [Mycoplasmoides fastidiosum]MDQ0514112.1 malonate-semialdehyde dehydrogenase (acetylating)/methylmalonate-semialdehyde dehydrogenase [Mycoplasmoides fastidiosum]UUD37480.1 aldehyde dehydrogenase family protein [Mycoplasmoides fastidiosum]